MMESIRKWFKYCQKLIKLYDFRTFNEKKVRNVIKNGCFCYEKVSEKSRFIKDSSNSNNSNTYILYIYILCILKKLHKYIYRKKTLLGCYIARKVDFALRFEGLFPNFFSVFSVRTQQKLLNPSLKSWRIGHV